MVPDLLINCVGLIKQRDSITSEQFIAVNSLLPHRLANICEENGLNMIHITTDCVFSGEEGDYNENAKHDVHDLYGKSKSMGEPINCSVIRSSIIGEEFKNKLSLLEWVKSNKGGEIDGYANHWWNGVTCLKLAEIISDIIENSTWWLGVKHIYSPSVNKFQLVQMINEIYELNIKINEVTNGVTVNRTLSSAYGEEVQDNLFKQIVEQKEFWSMINTNKYGNYISNLI